MKLKLRRGLPVPTNPVIGRIRWIAYSLGLTPKRGSILYSPSLDVVAVSPVSWVNLEALYRELDRDPSWRRELEGRFVEEDLPEATCPPVPHDARRCAERPTCGRNEASPPDPDDGTWTARANFGDETVDALLEHFGATGSLGPIAAGTRVVVTEGRFAGLEGTSCGYEGRYSTTCVLIPGQPGGPHFHIARFRVRALEG